MTAPSGVEYETANLFGLVMMPETPDLHAVWSKLTMFEMYQRFSWCV